MANNPAIITKRPNATEAVVPTPSLCALAPNMQASTTKSTISIMRFGVLENMIHLHHQIEIKMPLRNTN
jgi:hypothetical protein